LRLVVMSPERKLARRQQGSLPVIRHGLALAAGGVVIGVAVAPAAS
jgi:hypothetical protein